jgi:hypothetical protein
VNRDRIESTKAHLVKTILIRGLSHDPLLASRIQNGVLRDDAIPGNPRPIKPETGEFNRLGVTASTTADRTKMVE